jgi:DNA-binding transcriptional ArsR family regulator
MQQLKTIFRKISPSNSISRFKLSEPKKQKDWWTPIWKGLVTDERSKHRKRMGASVWLFLYLLTYTNRKTGIVRKKQATIAEETGYPIRTIQRHLKRLSQAKYITFLDSGHFPQIRIEKWKLFYHSNSTNDDASPSTKND